jgi:hypothetical protein
VEIVTLETVGFEEHTHIVGDNCFEERARIVVEKCPYFVRILFSRLVGHRNNCRVFHLDYLCMYDVRWVVVMSKLGGFMNVYHTYPGTESVTTSRPIQ